MTDIAMEGAAKRPQGEAIPTGQDGAVAIAGERKHWEQIAAAIASALNAT